MGRASEVTLRTIDTAKLFSLLAGRLDDATYLRVAAAAAESCGRGGVARILSSSGLGRAALDRARRELRTKPD